MIIGVAKEIKEQEYRVGLTPESVAILKNAGHKLLIEEGAGTGSGFFDQKYKEAGAEIVSKDEIFDNAEMVIKVKEPQLKEIQMMKKGQIVFTFFHFSSNVRMTLALIERQVTCVAYELIEENGVRPILKPMSEIAGKLSIQQGMKYLEKEYGGKGILLTGTQAVKPGRVVILGGGVVGCAAAEIASRIGTYLTIIEKDEMKRQLLKERFPGCVILDSTEDNIRDAISTADVIIGAVLISGHRTPILVSKRDLNYIEKGSVLVDVSIDEGGVFESSHPTTHNNPIFLESGIVHYCVPNIPGVVPRTSTIALNFATLSYVKTLAENGEEAFKKFPTIRSGLAILRGHIVHPALKEIAGL